MRIASLASVTAGWVALLAACGGLADQSTTNGNDVAAPERGHALTTIAPTPNAETVAAPDVVAEDAGVPSAIALTDDRVFFTTRTTLQSGVMNDAGALFAVFKRPGSHALLLSTDKHSAHYEALALDETHAYVATSDAHLLRIPLAGATEESIADLSAPAVSITVNDTHVVFATSAGVVERVPKDGTGEIEAVATVAGQPRAVSVDESDAIYVATSVTEGEGGTIVKIPVGGAEPSVLTTSASSPCAMIRDGQKLFFSASSAVHRLSLTGGPPSTVTAGSFAACAIAVDGNDVFFATGNVGLMRAPVSGGAPLPVMAAKHALPTPGAVAVDATHVYWLDSTSVLRVAKPIR
jgi:hypothetical protein